MYWHAQPRVKCMSAYRYNLSFLMCVIVCLVQVLMKWLDCFKSDCSDALSSILFLPKSAVMICLPRSSRLATFSGLSHQKEVCKWGSFFGSFLLKTFAWILPHMPGIARPMWESANCTSCLPLSTASREASALLRCHQYSSKSLEWQISEAEFIEDS